MLEFEDGETRVTVPKDPNGLFKYKIKLPEGLQCDQCILQVRLVVNFKEREFSYLKFTFSGIGTVEITGAVTTKLVNAVWVVVHRKLSGDVLTLPFRVQDHTTPLYPSHQHLEQRLQSLFQWRLRPSQILTIAMLFLPMTMTQEWMNGVKQTVKLETVLLMFAHVTHEKYGS